MEISGIYRFYQNGELIGEAENSMTQMGRVLAVKTIMGAIPNFATSMGVGVSSTDNQSPVNNLIPDYRLGLMTATTPVIGTNISTNSTYDAILFKGRLADPLFYRIYEVGLFSDPLLSGATGYKQELVLGFEPNDNLAIVEAGTVKYLNADGYSNTTYKLVDRTDPTYGDFFRIGRKALYLGGTSEVYTENSFTGLDGYDAIDELTLGFYASQSRTVTVKFYSGGSTSNSMTFTFPSSTTGYNVISKTISSGTVSGSFDWSDVTRVGVSSSGSYVIVDGLRFNDVNPIDTNRGMISRAVLPLQTPIVKLANIPVDIEYTLRIGFGG